MTTPFEFAPEEIKQLLELDLVRIVNRLIEDEGYRLGLLAHRVKTSLRMHQPDGGIDAFTDTGSIQSRYLDRAAEYGSSNGAGLNRESGSRN